MNMIMMGGAVLSGVVLALGLLRFQARRFSSPVQSGLLNEGHMAYLFGGKERASDVWWALLVNGGHLERSGTRNRGGVLGWRRTTVVPSNPALREVWEALPQRSCTSWWHAHTHSWAHQHRALQEDLVGRGLLPSASQWAGRQLQAVGMVVLLLGAAMLSWALGAPWVGLALFVTALLSMPGLGRPLDGFDTQAGHRQMAAWREEHAASARAPTAGTVGYAVALTGLGALAGTPYVVHARDGVSSSGSGSGGDGGFHGSMTDSNFSTPSAVSAGSSDYATSGGFGGEAASTSGDSGGSSGCGGCGGGGCGG